MRHTVMSRLQDQHCTANHKSLKRTLVGIIREPSQQPMSALTGTIVVALQGTLLGTRIEAL